MYRFFQSSQEDPRKWKNKELLAQIRFVLSKQLDESPNAIELTNANRSRVGKTELYDAKFFMFKDDMKETQWRRAKFDECLRDLCSFLDEKQEEKENVEDAMLQVAKQRTMSTWVEVLEDSNTFGSGTIQKVLRLYVELGLSENTKTYRAWLAKQLERELSKPSPPRRQCTYVPCSTLQQVLELQRGQYTFFAGYHFYLDETRYALQPRPKLLRFLSVNKEEFERVMQEEEVSSTRFVRVYARPVFAAGDQEHLMGVAIAQQVDESLLYRFVASADLPFPFSYSLGKIMYAMLLQSQVAESKNRVFTVAQKLSRDVDLLQDLRSFGFETKESGPMVLAIHNNGKQLYEEHVRSWAKGSYLRARRAFDLLRVPPILLFTREGVELCEHLYYGEAVAPSSLFELSEDFPKPAPKLVAATENSSALKSLTQKLSKVMRSATILTTLAVGLLAAGIVPHTTDQSFGLSSFANHSAPMVLKHKMGSYSYWEPEPKDATSLSKWVLPEERNMNNRLDLMPAEERKSSTDEESRYKWMSVGENHNNRNYRSASIAEYLEFVPTQPMEKMFDNQIEEVLAKFYRGSGISHLSGIQDLERLFRSYYKDADPKSLFYFLSLVMKDTNLVFWFGDADKQLDVVKQYVHTMITLFKEIAAKSVQDERVLNELLVYWDNWSYNIDYDDFLKDHRKEILERAKEQASTNPLNLKEQGKRFLQSKPKDPSFSLFSYNTSTRPEIVTEVERMLSKFRNDLREKRVEPGTIRIYAESFAKIIRDSWDVTYLYVQIAKEAKQILRSTGYWNDEIRLFIDEIGTALWKHSPVAYQEFPPNHRQLLYEFE